MGLQARIRVENRNGVWGYSSYIDSGYIGARNWWDEAEDEADAVECAGAIAKLLRDRGYEVNDAPVAEEYVRDEEACPACGEDRMEYLTWIEDGELVECQSCGVIYDPTGRG